LIQALNRALLVREFLGQELTDHHQIYPAPRNSRIQLKESPTIIGVESSQIRDSDLISVVVPAFNSESFVSMTLDRIVQSMESIGYKFEIVIVNDGSTDGTWRVISGRAKGDTRIVAINLLKNYGQHSALMCGLRHTSGKYVVTLDDDLQNPPEEIAKLLNHCHSNGHDLVIGEFAEPQKAKFRMFGTDVVNKIVTRVFNKPPQLKLSTFRVIRRDVVNRVCQSTNPTPYITGELLYAAASISNISVRHDARIAGKSTYNPFKIFELVRRITFSYSIELLRLACRAGTIIAGLSFLFSGAMTIHGTVTKGVVPGWTSIVTAISFFAGIIILLLSMIGEYLSVVLLQNLGTPAYREAGVVKNGQQSDSSFQKFE
jgi:undecaprenyl-phosphate 4-deoxy-4-formamido-L-arabinose transferase